MSKKTVVDRYTTRLEGLYRLGEAEHGPVIEKVNGALADIHASGSRPDSVLVRRGFVARSKPMHGLRDRDNRPRLKPPAAELVASRGLALRLELVLLYLAQCYGRTSARVPLPVTGATDDEDAIGLVNLFSTGTRTADQTKFARDNPAKRAKQIENALDRLADPRLALVQLAPGIGRSRFERIALNRETGSPARKDPSKYTLPTQDDLISIPIPFFTNGWIQVLSDSEIANWLAFRDRGEMRTADAKHAHGLTMNVHTRLGTYDLTKDAWDTHLMLGRAGILIAESGEVSSEQREDGQYRFRKDPNVFRLDDAALEQNGQTVMIKAVHDARDAAEEEALRRAESREVEGST